MLKRREVFSWLRAKNNSIYFLQEVHCCENTSTLWSTEWGYKSYFSCCTGAKAGVSILFNNTFDFEMKRVYCDPNRRFIICDIQTNEKYLTLATMYAPNNDDAVFFKGFFEHLLDFQCEEVVIGGDFNLVLNLEKDKKGGVAKTHNNSFKVVQEFMENLDLTDAWRVLHPDSLRYTWRRRKPEIQCRLDFFLVSQSLMCNVTHADISTGYKTDHSMINISITVQSNPRGPGFWKLNTIFLTEIEYVNQIKSTIQAVKEEYQNDDTMNHALLWEVIKMKTREQSLKYAAAKKAKILKREEDLEKAINNLQLQIETTSDNEGAKQLELEKKGRAGKYNRVPHQRCNFKIEM